MQVDMDTLPNLAAMASIELHACAQGHSHIYSMFPQISHRKSFEENDREVSGSTYLMSGQVAEHPLGGLGQTEGGAQLDQQCRSGGDDQPPPHHPELARKSREAAPVRVDHRIRKDNQEHAERECLRHHCCIRQRACFTRPASAEAYWHRC